MVTLENLCDNFSLGITQLNRCQKIVFLKNFKEKFDNYEIFEDVDNKKNNKYTFWNEEYCLTFFPYDIDRMVIFKKLHPPYTTKQFNANAYEVIQVQSLLKEFDFQLNLSQKIQEMFINDYKYYFDSKILNNEGYESYIFKSETDTHQYMLTITPEDEEKTLIEYIRPKGENRKVFEEITKSDGSLYSIT